jgi:uncharacterized protein (TIGR02145 family)
MKVKILIMLAGISLLIMNLTAQEKGTFTDPRDGKVYKTIKLGEQIWMAENLKYGSKGHTYDYKTYGWLYDWYKAQEVCPSGWHLPSVNEWKEMIESFGKIYNEEGTIPKKKEVSKEEWIRINELYRSTFQALIPGGSSGFDVLYAGQQDPNTFQGVNLSTMRSTYSGGGLLTHFWTTDHFGGKSVQFKSIYAMSFHFQKSGKSGIFTEMKLRKSVRSSVRCVYGEPLETPEPELPEVPADTLGFAINHHRK